MDTATSAEHFSVVQDVGCSANSTIKVCMHTVRTASTDVRAMRAGAALAKAGFDVSMLDIESEHAPSAEEDREGIHVKHLLVPDTFFATRFKRWMLFRAMAMLIRSVLYLVRERADVYHALDLPALPACYIAATVCHKPLVFESYELPLSTLPLAEMNASQWFLQMLFTFFLSYVIPRCAAVIVVSPPIEKEICKRYSCANIIVVRNVAPYQTVLHSEKLRNHLGLAPYTRVALYQGYLQPDRGLDILVKAARFLEENVVVAIMGEDRHGTQARLEALIVGEGVADRVKIIPAVPYEELLEWTASADIGLIIYQPDYSQNVQMMLPNKLFEFLMAGVPVLASPLEAVVDTIRSYDVGRVVSSLTPADIGAAINAMLADQYALDRMGCSAVRAAYANLNWEKEQQKLVRLYHGILVSNIGYNK